MKQVTITVRETRYTDEGVINDSVDITNVEVGTELTLRRPRRHAAQGTDPNTWAQAKVRMISPTGQITVRVVGTEDQDIRFKPDVSKYRDNPTHYDMVGGDRWTPDWVIVTPEIKARERARYAEIEARSKKYHTAAKALEDATEALNRALRYGEPLKEEGQAQLAAALRAIAPLVNLTDIA